MECTNGSGQLALLNMLEELHQQLTTVSSVASFLGQSSIWEWV